ncbi:MAG: lipopolysaccharide biosynthesis protein RfbH [Spirochaetes bacterium]|nr:lipopolysaccharide biosynthesis protein RfbH [Spirochaetota bacterium]
MNTIEKKKRRIHKSIEKIFKNRNSIPNFIAGETQISTGLAVYDHLEINAVIDTLLDGWFGLAEKGDEFEKALSRYLSVEHTVFVNSGSSANLLALDAVKQLKNPEKKEIITPALAFPATFNPIVQLGFKPAVVDVDNTLNISLEQLLSAVNENTAGIMFTHCMGNPAKIDEICEIAEKHDLFIIEDTCGALGSFYNDKPCGSFGTASTYSFYPAHGITTGEGGAVATNDQELDMIIRKLRDWGRDCRCKSNALDIDGECNNRFNYRIDNFYYDHRYVFSQLGYNMKPLELQAAMGIEQLKKLDAFNKQRKKNFNLYKQELSQFKDFIELPEIYEQADPVFFGLPIIINNPNIDRRDLLIFLNRKKIATRLLFAGNILKQPGYRDIECSVYGNLSVSDKIMKDCFWIGIHPGITEEMISYVINAFREYFSSQV